MAQNTTIEAYDRLINAVQTFKSSNNDIASEIRKCSNNAITAMKGDTTSKELESFVDVIISKMRDIDEKAEILKKHLENIRDQLSQI